MLKIGEYMTIITLWKQGRSKREIARLLGHDRQTIRKVIKKYEAKGIEQPVKISRESIVSLYKEAITKYLEQGLSGVRIYEELQKQGCKGKYRTVCHYILQLKGRKDICVRFHTAAGEEAQVDFGYAGMLPDKGGKRRKAWVFNMRLSYSRLDYYEVVFDQKVRTFIECHINGFNYFGGVPGTVKIDNLKAAILEANFYEPIYQSLYKQFSEHYQFNAIVCRVARPQEKGKVESGIKYVKNNFFAGRRFNNNTEMSLQMSIWLEQKCNSRVHGTTRKIPRELFVQEERQELKPLPISDFTFAELAQRKVYRDCHITVNYNYYSVPYEYVGKVVDVQQDNKLVKVFYQNKQVAIHIKGQNRGEFITNESHYPAYKLFSHKSSEYRSLYKGKMQEIGAHAGQLFTLILEQQPQSWYRTTTGILSLKKLYCGQVIDSACKRALAFNISSYSKIKSICASGSYVLPTI